MNRQQRRAMAKREDPESLWAVAIALNRRGRKSRRPGPRIRAAPAETGSHRRVAPPRAALSLDRFGPNPAADDCVAPRAKPRSRPLPPALGRGARPPARAAAG